MLRSGTLFYCLGLIFWLLAETAFSQELDVDPWGDLGEGPVRQPPSMSRLADEAWESREAVRSQLFERIPESPVVEAWEEYQAEQPVERFKRGFFQRAAFSGGWLGTGDSADLGVTTWETSVSFAIPLGSFENLLVVTPTFRADYLDGPLTPDVPSQLYETGASFLWRKEVHPRWSLMTLVSPMIRSDFESTEDALRVFGLGLATWEWIPGELKLSMGAVYLDRQDVGLLPAIGLEWTPEPWWKVDLMFPRPRISYRLLKEGANRETWAYLGGSLGGNTWSVRRADGTDDQLSLRDFRLMLGLETIRSGGGGHFIEMGYVFGRRLEYAVEELETEFDDALTIRTGLAY